MSKGIRDSAGYYQPLTENTGLAAGCQLRFDRGTLLLEGSPTLPFGVENWFRYDPRVDAYRAPAHCYAQVISLLRGCLVRNQAPRYGRLQLACALPVDPYPHQRDALNCWQTAWFATRRPVMGASNWPARCPSIPILINGMP